MLLDSGIELNWFVVAIRTDKACAEKGIVPIEYYCCFMKLWLLKRRKPDFLVGELAKKISSNIIICSIFREEVQGKSIWVRRHEAFIDCGDSIFRFFSCTSSWRQWVLSESNIIGIFEFTLWLHLCNLMKFWKFCHSIIRFLLYYWCQDSWIFFPRNKS